MAVGVSALRFAPALAWTALIAWFSAESWSAPETGALLLPVIQWLLPGAAPEQIAAAHALVRKGAHVFEYAVLGGLWRWGLADRVARAWRPALALCALTATLDEVHQATTAARTGAAADVILDTTGAAIALIAIEAGGTALDRIIGVLLWTAATGGAVLIAINWAAGAPSGWLWLSAPTAAIALYLWRRIRRQ
jgi:VanZ family protein